MKYLALACVLVAVAGCQSHRSREGARVDNRPNFIVINVDELRADALEITGHPFVKTPNINRLAKEGMLMKNSFVTTPLCGPSRCSTLSGQYVHTHGLYRNTVDSGLTQRLITYPLLLHYAGYKTAFIGKWTTGRNADRTPHPGFDRWFCTGTNRDYKMNPVVNVDGERRQFQGHATDIESEEAIRFIRENKDHPFSIDLWHRSVHTSYGTENLIASERNRNLYKDVPVKRAISAWGGREKGPENEPSLQSPGHAVQPALRNVHMKPPTDEDIRNISRMLVDIDDGIGRLLKVLEEEKLLDKTVIIFTGDNGFFFGEHGLTEKRLAYEEDIRVPFIVRYPPLVAAGSVSEVPVLNIDIAPTLLNLAGLPPQRHMEGKSLVPVWKGGQFTDDSRSTLLFEFWPEVVHPKNGITSWKAIRTSEWKYVHWLELEGADELYHLKDDPFEMNNLASDPAYAGVLEEMKHRLTEKMNATNDPGTFMELLQDYARLKATAAKKNKPKK
jgi:N-acetylglucosamine-6-sulfatase